jgi:hypothetical protein
LLLLLLLLPGRLPKPVVLAAICLVKRSLALGDLWTCSALPKSSSVQLWGRSGLLARCFGVCTIPHPTAAAAAAYSSTERRHLPARKAFTEMMY